MAKIKRVHDSAADCFGLQTGEGQCGWMKWVCSAPLPPKQAELGGPEETTQQKIKHLKLSTTADVHFSALAIFVGGKPVGDQVLVTSPATDWLGIVLPPKEQINKWYQQQNRSFTMLLKKYERLTHYVSMLTPYTLLLGTEFISLLADFKGLEHFLIL